MTNRLFYSFLLIIVCMTTTHAQNETGSGEKRFEPVETSAAYPGGEKAWQQYLKSNLDTNVAKKNGAPIGKYTVVVQFIVDTMGQISDVKALTNLGYGMEEEAMRIMRKGASWNPAPQKGPWIPAPQNGRVIKSYRKQSFVFMVEDPAVTVITQTAYTLFTNTDNKAAIRVNKVKSEDLRLMITNGLLIKTGGENYIIKANQPGRASLKIFKGKKGKQLAEVSFEVLNGPIIQN